MAMNRKKQGAAQIQDIWVQQGDVTLSENLDFISFYGRDSMAINILERVASVYENSTVRGFK
jgi:hypothetical protein